MGESLSSSSIAIRIFSKSSDSAEASPTGTIPVALPELKKYAIAAAITTTAPTTTSTP